MKRITGMFLFILFSILLSCDEFYIVNCSDCDLIEPLTCELLIKVNEIDLLAPSHYIVVYQGTVEDGLVYSSFSTLINKTIIVPLNSQYTVVSNVRIDGKNYTLVDSTTPKVREIVDYCDEICYWVINNTVNLKLKYN